MFYCTASMEPSRYNWLDEAAASRGRGYWELECPTEGTEACWWCQSTSGWLSLEPNRPVSASLRGCAPANPKRLGRGSAISTRTGLLPAGYPSVMQGRGAAAPGLMMAVLSYGARLQAATRDRAWRSPRGDPGDSAGSARYRSP